jgi:hypothetical protein
MAKADTLRGLENELRGQEAKLALAEEREDETDATYRRERIALIEAELTRARSGGVAAPEPEATVLEGDETAEAPKTRGRRKQADDE